VLFYYPIKTTVDLSDSETTLDHISIIWDFSIVHRDSLHTKFCNMSKLVLLTSGGKSGGVQYKKLPVSLPKGRS